MARFSGVEITESSVRVADLEGSPKKYRILGAAEIPIAEGDRDRPDAVVQAARAAFKASKARKDQVVLGIPAREAIVREIVVPFTDPEQIKKVIKFESEGHLHGVDIEDVVVDFHKIQEHGMRSWVLVIAVPKERIKFYLSILGRAGVDPQFIDMDATALFSFGRLLPEVQEMEDAGQVILDLGDVTSSIIVYQGEKLRMVRSMRMGSESLVRAVADELEIEPEEARTLTRSLLTGGEPFTLPETPREAPATALTTIERRADVARDKEAWFARRITAEIQRSLSSVQMEGRLSAIWLTGPASSSPRLELLLGEAFEVPVAPLDTLSQAEHKLPPETALFVGTPAGLALKGLGHDPLGLDFRQEELRFTRKFEKIQTPLMLAGLFVFLILAFLSIDAYLKSRARKELIDYCGRQAIADMDQLLVKDCLHNAGLREILGYKNLDDVKRLLPAIKRQPAEKWVSRVLTAIVPPKEHIYETFGIETEGERTESPEGEVDSALIQAQEFVAAVKRAMPKLGETMVDRLRVSPNELTFTLRTANVLGWDVLAKEFAKMKRFKEATRGVQDLYNGDVYILKNCKIRFEKE